MKNKIIIIFLSFLILSCNSEDFSPVGNYEKKVVTYLILDNRINNQIIKVQSDYLVNDKNTSKKINNLNVYLINDNNKYTFSDTIIPDSKNYSYFVLRNFIPIRGAKYSLYISGDEVPTATSEIYVPPKSDVTLYYDSDKIQLTYYRNRYVKGYLHHLYVDFYIKDDKNNVIKNGRVEVPIGIEILNDGKDTIKYYPTLTKDVSFNYSYSNLFTVLMENKPKDDKYKLVVKKSVATVLSLEENLYNYYVTVKGFSDPYSVRLDQINYSNIKNGYGIFGAITIDSTIERIPPFIIYGFGFEPE